MGGVSESASRNLPLEWDAVSRWTASGKRVPEFGFGMGWAFRLRGLAESAFRNQVGEWDAVSGWGLRGKRVLELGLRVGCGFPMGPQVESAFRYGLGDPVCSVSEEVIFVADFPIRVDFVPFGKMRHAVRKNETREIACFV